MFRRRNFSVITPIAHTIQLVSPPRSYTERVGARRSWVRIPSKLLPAAAEERCCYTDATRVTVAQFGCINAEMGGIC